MNNLVNQYFGQKKTSWACKSAVFFDLSPDINNDNFEFNFFYKMTPTFTNTGYRRHTHVK